MEIIAPEYMNPICPYCDWNFGEWMDGKTKDSEKIQCPNCEKHYWCYTYPSLIGYSHHTKRLGRKPKNDK